MTLFERAMQYAEEKHRGMTRKLDDAPYILHPIEAAQIVSRFTDDEEIRAAAVLHDTVEDTDASLEDILALFGPRVAALVASETEEKRPDIPKAESWRIRKEESLSELKSASDPAVKYIWLGDKLSNIRGIYRAWKRLGDGVWLLFNQHDPAQHAWYYRGVAKLLSDLSSSPEWQEYNALVEEIFASCRGETK